jgi:hypothetical protein
LFFWGQLAIFRKIAPYLFNILIYRAFKPIWIERFSNVLAWLGKGGGLPPENLHLLLAIALKCL